MLWHDNIYGIRGWIKKPHKLKALRAKSTTHSLHSLTKCLQMHRVVQGFCYSLVEKHAYKKIVSKKNKFSQQTIAENEWKKNEQKKPPPNRANDDDKKRTLDTKYIVDTFNRWLFPNFVLFADNRHWAAHTVARMLRSALSFVFSVQIFADRDFWPILNVAWCCKC